MKDNTVLDKVIGEAFEVVLEETFKEVFEEFENYLSQNDLIISIQDDLIQRYEKQRLEKEENIKELIVEITKLRKENSELKAELKAGTTVNNDPLSLEEFVAMFVKELGIK